MKYQISPSPHQEPDLTGAGEGILEVLLVLPGKHPLRLAALPHRCAPQRPQYVARHQTAIQ